MVESGIGSGSGSGATGAKGSGRGGGGRRLVIAGGGGKGHPGRVIVASLALVLAFVGLIAMFKSFKTIDAGDVGVTVCFGKVQGTLEPGFHVVAPWCDVTGIDVRTQTYAMVARSNEGKVAGDDSLSVQSSDSVGVKVDAAVIYHLDRTRAEDIYSKFRPISNIEDVVRNTSRRHIRDAAAPFSAEELIGSRRAQFGTSAQEQLIPALAGFGVTVERVEIRDISPTSESYKAAISAKVEQQQRSQAKQFELDAAQKDSQIKKVTAQADADAQKIKNAVPPAPELLQQQFIEALRNSQNRVIITDGKAPILLDQGAASGTPNTTTAK